MDANELRWEAVARKELLETRIFNANEVRARSENGIESSFVVLDAPDWATVVPVDSRDGKPCFLMVRQWRHGSSRVSLEFPGGVVESGEDPLEAAKRELLEETGFQAERVIPLGTVNPNPAFMANRFHVFLAEGLSSVKEQELDHDEIVHFEHVSVEEAESALLSDPDAHALMQVALFRYLEHERKRHRILS